MAQPSVAPTQKTCRECGETKPTTAFGKRRRICIACRTAYTKAWKNGFRKGPQYPIINDTHKVCSKCQTLKPLEDFRLLRGKERKPGARRSECKACASRYNHTYHATHADLRHQLWQNYYDARHEKMLLRAKHYYYDNQEERMAYHQAWTKAHPEKANAHGRKRKTVKRGLPSTFTHEEQAFCRQYFHYACAICGKQEGFQWIISLDHWIPLKSSDCPGTIATNMIPLCHGTGGCNNKKSCKAPFQWLTEQCGPRKAAQIRRKIDAYFAAVRERFPTRRSDQQEGMATD